MHHFYAESKYDNMNFIFKRLTNIESSSALGIRAQRGLSPVCAVNLLGLSEPFNINLLHFSIASMAGLNVISRLSDFVT